jgi:hypothetical protein
MWAAAVRGSDGRIYAFGGQNEATVEAYGPVLHLSANQAAAQSTITVSGENFAGNATVSVRFDSTTSPVVASGSTDHDGVLTPIALTVSVGPGAHRLTAVDNRSGYPVSTPLLVTP